MRLLQRYLLDERQVQERLQELPGKVSAGDEAELGS